MTGPALWEYLERKFGPSLIASNQAASMLRFTSIVVDGQTVRMEAVISPKVHGLGVVERTKLALKFWKAIA